MLSGNIETFFGWKRFAPRVEFVRHAGMFMRYLLDKKGIRVHVLYEERTDSKKDLDLVYFKRPRRPLHGVSPHCKFFALTPDPITKGNVKQVSFEDFEKLERFTAVEE